MTLSKGANTAVPTSLLAVVVSWRSDHVVDAHALLLTTAGTVRTDRDLVFYNAPRHISQAVILDQEPEPGTARLSVSLPRTEAEIDRIVISGSLDTGTFRAVDELALTVFDADGPIARYEITDADPVSAMMFGEFYRRAGQWKFRAVGQGWTSGLSGLITEFGVEVEEPAEPQSATGASTWGRPPSHRTGAPSHPGESAYPAAGYDADRRHFDDADDTDELPTQQESGTGQIRPPGSNRTPADRDRDAREPHTPEWASGPTAHEQATPQSRAGRSPVTRGDQPTRRLPVADPAALENGPYQWGDPASPGSVHPEQFGSGPNGATTPGSHRDPATHHSADPATPRSVHDHGADSTPGFHDRAPYRQPGSASPTSPDRQPHSTAPDFTDGRDTHRQTDSAQPSFTGGRTNDRQTDSTAPDFTDRRATPRHADSSFEHPDDSASLAQRPDTAPPTPGGNRATPRRPVDLSRRTMEGPDPVPPPPPNPERADWHTDPENPARLRWWDGAEWTSAWREPAPTDPRACERCGNPRRRKLFGRLAPCERCALEIEEFLIHWHTQAWRVLTSSGPQGPDWDALWASLRYQRIEESAGRAALRDGALSYVERLVTFAFADGEIAQAEFEAFEIAIVELRLSGPLIDDLHRRMVRGRMLSRLREGELPAIRTPGLHLDPEERVHLDLPATHVRQLARGPRLSEGRLIASNKKLRFVGEGAGTELPWSRVVSVAIEDELVVLSATSARGGASFEVDDPDYVAAALEGALRVAKRLVLTPGQRDSRSIPQEVKAEVWQRDGGRCVECGSSHYLEFDHVIPLSRGGATSASNLQILCRTCNRVKGARI
ncbi:TerD family protein [Nocardia sp. NPDC048505]|uniref:TerD family protein n=1 Tax=unclassified Nocardia TaxID=2637762 RepID=UPI0033D150C3